MSEANSFQTQSKYADDEASILKMIRYIETEIENNGDVHVDENDARNIEIEIKTSHVMIAIDQAIQKLEIAFCFQWIVDENQDEINKLRQGHLARKYGNDMSMFVTQYKKIRDDNNMDVCRNEPMFINCVNAALELGLGRFVNQHRYKLSGPETAFLSTMTQFKYMAEWRMGMSAMKALNKEKTLHKMWTTNEKMKTNISRMETELLDNGKKLQQLIDQKNHVIAEHNKTIADLEKKNSDEMNAEIFKSNKILHKVCLVSEKKQKILSTEAAKMKEKYETLVQSNLLIEKERREQKSKTRENLEAMLTKYDNRVGERYAKLMRVKDEVEAETLLYENKMKEFRLQEIEYNQIMADKAEVEAKIREEKLILFMMNRSARIIQRAYKKMMKKRKKKKGKKGKKKAAKRKTN